MAVHAPVRHRAGRPRHRPPGHPAGPGRRRLQGRLRLRRRPLGVPVVAGLGPGHAVARDAARRQRPAHGHQRLRRAACVPHVAQGPAVHRHGVDHPAGHAGDLHLRPEHPLGTGLRES
ncbi:hypothetical protein SGPA1_12342 [Streptomyces misionensis JCM 4497]